VNVFFLRRPVFVNRSTDDTPAAEALARWATEIVPAVRDAIAKP
jgi:hypothetical protein